MASTGIIYPPPDTKAVIDKTAQFVAKHGTEFESKIAQKEAGNPKFAFFLVENPFNAYYRFKVSELKGESAAPAAPVAAPVPANAAAPTPAAAPASAPQAEAPKSSEAVMVKAAKASYESRAIPISRPKQVVPPRVSRFTLPVEVETTAMQLDIMKVTAQFAARNGKKFINLITSERVGKNPDFDFLRPQNPRYFHFRALVDAYALCMDAPPELMDELKNNTSQPMSVLERCNNVAEFNIQEDEKRRKQEEEEDMDRQAFRAIDWYDFVVVETIDFADDEVLPAPDLQHLSVQDEHQVAPSARDRERAPAPVSPVVMVPRPAEQEEDVEMELDDMIEGAMGAPLGSFGEQKKKISRADEERNKKIGVVHADEMEDEDEEDIEAKVKRDYVRSIQHAQAHQLDHVKDPITGKLIPLSSAQDYLRIELLDPKWKQQRQMLADRNKETNITNDEEMVRNLQRFARRRTDIFGEDEPAAAAAAAAAEEAAKKPVVMWDGHSTSASRTIDAYKALQSPEEIAAAERARLAELARIGPQIPADGIPPPSASIPAPVVPMPMPVAGPSVPYPQQQPLPAIGSVRPAPVPSAPQEVEMEDEISVKRPRLEAATTLAAESTWLAAHPGPFTVRVQLPTLANKPEWKCTGQVLDVVLEMGQPISALKERLHAMLTMPMGKMKLNIPTIGFLKDSNTTSFYNMQNGTTVALSLKERGGQ